MSRYPGVSLILDGETISSLAERIIAGGSRGTLTGPHGSGKTTLLERLYEEFTKRGIAAEICYLPEERGPRLLTLLTLLHKRRRDAVQFIDRGEATTVLERGMIALLAASTHGIIMTTHAETLLPVLYRTRTSSELLQHVASELARSEGKAAPPAALCREMFHRRHGNIRESLLELYDLYGRGARE